MGEDDREAASPGQAGVPAPLRLKKRRDFLHVAGGRKGHSALCTVQARAQAGGADRPRVGLTVTRKVGNAVERNRIKRRLREALRLDTALPLAPGQDYVIVARRPMLSAPFPDLCRGLRLTLGKAQGAPRRPSDRRPAAAPPRP